jgi:hypothetical protein
MSRRNTHECSAGVQHDEEFCDLGACLSAYSHASSANSTRCRPCYRTLIIFPCIERNGRHTSVIQARDDYPTPRSRGHDEAGLDDAENGKTLGSLKNRSWYNAI